MVQLMDIAVHGGVLLLQGACGVGKTSLALECAHRLPRALGLARHFAIPTAEAIESGEPVWWSFAIDASVCLPPLESPN